jgi:anti-anti-sigma factor
MTARGQFTVRHVDGCPVVDVSGEVDLTNVRELEAALNEAAKADSGGVVVSLEGTTYIDSQGVRALYAAGERLAIMRQRLLLVVRSGSTSHRILQIAGAEALYSIFDSVDKAVSAKID